MEKRKPGRPPSGGLKRTQILSAKFTFKEKAKFVKMAKESGLTQADFILWLLDLRRSLNQ